MGFSGNFFFLDADLVPGVPQRPCQTCKTGLIASAKLLAGSQSDSNSLMDLG
jgi:hypothetical protein